MRKKEKDIIMSIYNNMNNIHTNMNYIVHLMLTIYFDEKKYTLVIVTVDFWKQYKFYMNHISRVLLD